MNAEQFDALVRSLVTAAQSAQAAAQSSAAATGQIDARIQAALASANPQTTTAVLRDEGRCVNRPELFNPKTFEEEQSRWDDWKHVLLNYACTQDPGFNDELGQVDRDRTDNYDIELMGEQTARRCRFFYGLLCSYIRGRFFKMIRVHERSRNGYLAWRDLLVELEPRERGRGLALLVGLVSEANWPAEQPEFLDQVRDWDRLARQYEEATSKPVPDDLKVAVVLRHAPGEVGTQLRMAANADMTYAALLLKLKEHYVSTRPWSVRVALDPKHGSHGDTHRAYTNAPSATPMAMDVDQVTSAVVAALYGKGKQGKGKGGGKGGKSGKGGKGDGKSKGKGKGGAGAGKGGKSGPQGGCYACGGAHYQRDCPKSGKGGGKQSGASPGGNVQAVQDSNAAAQSSVGSTAAGSSSSGSSSSLGPSASQVRSLTREPLSLARQPIDEEMWIMAVSLDIRQTTTDGPGHWILVDSGADDHVCPEWYAPHVLPTENADALRLYDVQGNLLAQQGCKQVLLNFGSEEDASFSQSAQVTFVIGSVRGPLLSLGKLIRAGCTIGDRNGLPCLERLGKRIPLALRRNSLYLYATFADVLGWTDRPLIAPVAEEEADLEMPNAEPAAPDGQGDADLPVPAEAVPEAQPEPAEAVPAAEEDDVPVFLGTTPLHPGSRLEAMRQRLRELRGAVYGRKSELWTRLQRYEKARLRENVAQAEIERRERELADGPPSVRPGPLMIPGVTTPTAIEVESHELNHIPPKPWCLACQRGKANDMGHARLGDDASTASRPYLCSDLCYHGITGEEIEREKVAETDEEDIATVGLVAVDGQSGYPMAVMAPSKGGRDLEYFSRSMVRFAALMRHRRMTLMADQEPSLKDLLTKVVKAREHETDVRWTPTGSSASNGRAERMIQTVRKQTVTMKLCWESRFGIPLLGASCLLPWLFRHAAWILARYHVKVSGRTAYEDVHDTSFRQEILPWGEIVLFRLPQHKAKLLPKLSTPWNRGLWVGKTESTSEHLVLTPTGAQRCRAVRRLPEDRAHDKEFVKTVRGVPWDMGSGAIGRPKQSRGVGNFPVSVPLYPGAAGGERERADEPAQSEGASADAAGDGNATPTGPVAPGTPIAQEGGEVQPTTPMSTTADAPAIDDEMVDLGNLAVEPGLEMDLDMLPVPHTSWAAREAVPAQHGLTPPSWAGSIRSLLTADEELDLNYDELQGDYQIEYPDEEDQESYTPEMEAAGVRKELDNLRDAGLYQAVKPEDADPNGRFITTTWVKKAKMVDGEKVCRARFVGRDYKWLDPHAPGLFAPTTSCSTQRLVDFVAVKRGWPTLTADVPSAFLHTPLPDDMIVYCTPPAEWVAEDPENRTGLLWRVLKVLAGMREGPKLWLEYFGDWLRDIGFRNDPTNVNYFVSEARGNCLSEVHMDDIHGTAEYDELEKFAGELVAKFGVRYAIHSHKNATYDHLRRLRVRTPQGMHIRAGEHHYEHMLKLFDLDPRSKAKPTPLPCSVDINFEGEELPEDEKRVYRSGVGILLYIAADRADVQYATQLLAQKLSKPTDSAMSGLKHIPRYLMGTKSWGYFFPVEGEVHEIVGTSDSNWANCRETRRSTGCGVISAGGCCLYTFVRRQAVVSLSSAEAEFYASASCMSETVGIKRLLELAGFYTKGKDHLLMRALGFEQRAISTSAPRSWTRASP